MIRNATLEDAKDIVKIYNYYILNTNITFEVEEIDTNEMKNRIEKKLGKEPWIIYEEDGKVLGYAYIGEWRSRAAFRNTKEVSIYLDSNEKGKGIGSKLLKELIKLAKEYKVHTLMAGITIPNEYSIGLHEKFGFKKVGHCEQVGFKNNQWLDLGFWQLHINS